MTMEKAHSAHPLLGSSKVSQGGVTSIGAVKPSATRVKMKSRGQQEFPGKVKGSTPLQRSSEEVKIQVKQGRSKFITNYSKTF